MLDKILNMSLCLHISNGFDMSERYCGTVTGDTNKFNQDI